MVLNGKWNFELYNSVNEAFSAVISNVLPSKLIQVPSNWQMESNSDAPIYTNVQYVRV